MQQVKNFYPLCMLGEIYLAYVNSGHILPCCFADARRMYNDERFGPLFKDSLKISNVGSVEDIITSDEWVEFFQTLQSNPPALCRDICVRKDNKPDADPSAIRISVEGE